MMMMKQGRDGLDIMSFMLTGTQKKGAFTVFGILLSSKVQMASRRFPLWS